MAAAKKLPPFMKSTDKDTAKKGAATPFPPDKSGKKAAVSSTLPAPKKGASAAKGMCPACLKAKKKTCTH